MYQNDNVVINLPKRLDLATLKRYKIWLRENNIKYSVVRVPLWNPIATGINMRNEDALVFKLIFGL